MKTHYIDKFSIDFLQVIADQATGTCNLQCPITQASDEDGVPAGAVHPARESGWIAWWPGDDPKGELAQFTRDQYQHGFESPYRVGDVLCSKSKNVMRFKVVKITAKKKTDTWVWVIKLTRLLSD